MDKKLKTNAIFNLVYQLMSIMLPLITMPYIARVLGVSNVGIQSYTLSIVSYFVLFATFGLNDYGQREIARNQDDKNKVSKLFFELIGNRLLTSTIVIFIYIILTLTIFEANYLNYYLILLLNILAVTFDIGWFFQGIENFKTLAIRNTIIKITMAIAIFIFINDSNDLSIYILINSLSLVLSSLSVWLILPKYIVRTKFEIKNILKHFRGSLVFFIPTIAIQIYTVLDKSMIQWITNSDIQNGIYDQAERIAKVSLTIIQFMNVIMCSRMAYLFKNHKLDEAKNICNKSLHLLSFLIFPMALGVILISDNIIPIYLGNGYEGSIILLKIFSFLIIFIAISGFIGSHYMAPTGQQGKSNVVLILGSIINFFLNLVLIPKFEAIGAAISSVIAEGIIAILYIYNGRNFFGYKTYFQVFIKNIISAVIMFVSVYFITNNITLNNWGMLFTKIGLGASIYIVSLLLLKDGYLLNILNKGINRIFKHQ